MTYLLAAGLARPAACERAAAFGAAVLAGPDPIAAQRPLSAS